MKNEMEMYFDAISENESLARMAVAAFALQKNPTLEELTDIKTAVSEAVTNAIIHGYGNTAGYGKHGEVRPVYEKLHPGKVRMKCLLEQGILHIEIEDWGKGIENVEQAMEPLYTTQPQLNRSGMGFAFMEAFMDEVEVKSEVEVGTVVIMRKKMESGSFIQTDENR